jgi:group II intron reverse transcriptase/maturase
MKKQKEIVYQEDLFIGQMQKAILHSETRPDDKRGGGNVKETAIGKEHQVIQAGEKERALTENLMLIVCSQQNLTRAYKQVKSNKGSAGIDKIGVDEFLGWYTRNETELIETLLTGKYQPSVVKGVEIDKPDGGKRLLGIPTVKDRFIQQAIYQVLNPIYEREFSESSYGFREKRSAQQALAKSKEYVKEGRNIVVDIDLEKFFDNVNHDKLMYKLSLRIKDKIVLKLIRKFLQSGIMLGGIVSQRTKGTPQGSPLSPLLSNIVLDELDKELEKRGHKFCRYADDCNIYVKSEKAGERVMQTISNFIEKKLKLKVNRKKSKVGKCYECKFLGHIVLLDGELGISPKNLERVKDKIRQITKRNRGKSLAEIIAELNSALKGWLNYFRYAKMQKHVGRLDEWIRRKLRCFRLKQCKRNYAIYKFLRKLGVEKRNAWKVALSGKGWWRLSSTPQAHQAMNKKWFDRQGLINLTLSYAKLKH